VPQPLRFRVPQQLRGYKVKEKWHLGVREQKGLNIIVLNAVEYFLYVVQSMCNVLNLHLQLCGESPDSLARNIVSVAERNVGQQPDSGAPKIR
jgi:hypothetical protein